METFTGPRSFVHNQQYVQYRIETIDALDLKSIDEPILDIVSAFIELPYCFPLQSCYGHFVCTADQDIYTLSPIPKICNDPIRYRIAYLAVCIKDSHDGRRLNNALSEIQAVDPVYIQFGSADWFWNQFPNSYVLQVEPPQYMQKDEAILEYSEAKHVQSVRDQFFIELRNRLSDWLEKLKPHHGKSNSMFSEIKT